MGCWSINESPYCCGDATRTDNQTGNDDREYYDGLARLAVQSFDYWDDPEEDVYDAERETMEIACDPELMRGMVLGGRNLKLGARCRIIFGDESWQEKMGIHYYNLKQKIISRWRTFWHCGFYSSRPRLKEYSIEQLWKLFKRVR